jgi:hypothetical protein
MTALVYFMPPRAVAGGIAMYAVEFEADIRDGVVKIPAQYSAVNNTHARVVILVNPGGDDRELKAFSEHAANQIEDWKDETEDAVWT